MDEILNQFRARAEITARRAAGLPEDWQPARTLPEKPTFRGEDLPGGMPAQASLPFFPHQPGIHPDREEKKTEAYYRRYENSAPETIEKLLTEKEEAFCQFYAITRNGAASARAAGWKPSSAYNTSYRLLLKNTIRQRITHLLQFNYYNDQATPAHALALVMSALQGGPDPDFRLRAARTILDIYKTANAPSLSSHAESGLPGLLKNAFPPEDFSESPQPESNVLNNNTFIQINGISSPQISTPSPQSSTDLQTQEALSPPNLHKSPQAFHNPVQSPARQE